MTNTIKTIAASLAAFTFVGTAIAQDDVTTAFSFDAEASIEANYEEIRSTAKEACDALHPRRTTSFSNAYNRLKKDCRERLVSAAVDAIADPYLIALHTGDEVETQTFASNN